MSRNVTNHDIENERFEDNLDAVLTVRGLETISKKVRESVINGVTKKEARFLVDSYYQIQRFRLASDNQIRSIVRGQDDQDEYVLDAIDWFAKSMRNQEVQLKAILDFYSKGDPVGRWCQSIIGIGPVIAAGCLSYYDFSKVRHYNQFWSYSGLNDYNNPWLGKEKATAMANQVFAEMEESDELVRESLGSNWINPKMERKIKKFLKPYGKMDGYGDITLIGDMRSDEVFREFINDLRNILEDDIDAVSSFIIRNYIDSKAVTEQAIIKTCSKSNRTHASVMKGITSTIKNRKGAKNANKFIFNPKKNDLVAYLSKPPYNIQAKQLCFFIGESFVKQSNRPKSLYGRLYRERKAFEIANNENKMYAEQAEKQLAEKNYKKDTDAYKAYSQGMLPPQHIHRRAKRYAVRMFLSHLYEAMYINHYHEPLKHSSLYPMEYLGHIDYIGPEVPFELFIK